MPGHIVNYAHYRRVAASFRFDIPPSRHAGFRLARQIEHLPSKEPQPVWLRLSGRVVTHDLELDAQLNKDCQQHGKVGSTPCGWTRVAVSGPCDFAAQLYQGPDGQYKIAFRGASGQFNSRHAQLNRSIIDGTWSAEMTQSVKFTYYAIKQVQRMERGLSFGMAKARLGVTGHGQGAFIAELNALLFGLSGSAFDGVGVAHLEADSNLAQLRSWVQALEPGAVLDRGVGDFIARRYTALAPPAAHGPNNTGHASGVRAEDAGASLALRYRTIVPGTNVSDSIAMPATILHPIDHIIGIEQTRKATTWLQKVDWSADLASVRPLAMEIRRQWTYACPDAVSMTSPDAVEAVLIAFLYNRSGQYVRVQHNQHSSRLVAGNDDELHLSRNGDGRAISRRGESFVQADYVDGEMTALITAHPAVNGNTFISHKWPSAFSTCTVDPMGQVLSGEYRHYDIHHQLDTESVLNRNADGSATIKIYDKRRVLQASVNICYCDDGTSIETATTIDGIQASLFDSDGILIGQSRSAGPMPPAPPAPLDHWFTPVPSMRPPDCVREPGSGRGGASANNHDGPDTRNDYVADDDGDDDDWWPPWSAALPKKD